VNQEPRIAAAIEAALRLNTVLDESDARDVVFHMTDWLDDMSAWARFCDDPESLSRKQTADLLLKYLAHVPNHVNAAHRLLYGEPVHDVFGIGATSGAVPGLPDGAPGDSAG